MAAVRFYNSLTHDVVLPRNSNLKIYTQLFFEKYSEQAVQKLKGVLTKGMAYYSKEYDLYIGGPRHTNSQYYIIDQ